MKAVWNNAVIAQSDDTVVVERNYYFPTESVKQEYLKPSATHTTCPWKGLASYYTLEVDGKSNTDAAWYYPEPKSGAEQVKDRVAFWKGVQVVEGVRLPLLRGQKRSAPAHPKGERARSLLFLLPSPLGRGWGRFLSLNNF